MEALKTADYTWVGFSGGKHKPQMSTGWNLGKIELELGFKEVALIHKTIWQMHGNIDITAPRIVRGYILKRPDPSGNEVVNYPERSDGEFYHIFGYNFREKTVMAGTDGRGESIWLGLVKDIEYHNPPFIHPHKEIACYMYTQENDLFDWLTATVCYTIKRISQKELLGRTTKFARPWEAS